MENNLVTLAIHTRQKAMLLKGSLEKENIPVTFEYIENDPNRISVRIPENTLTRALTIVEGINLFDYSKEQIARIDDGKKRILVAVDFSDYSMKACKVAFNIAHLIDAKVKILHVYHNIYFPSPLPFADMLKEEDIKKNIPDLLSKARGKMLGLCNEIDKKILSGEFPSVNYSYSLREGIVEEEIETFIKEYLPALLVTGTKGSNRQNTNMLGSVTADLIEMTNVPVLAVPEKVEIKAPNDLKHIVFLSNFKDRDMDSFNVLVETLKPYSNTKVTLLHINQINKDGVKWSSAELLQIKEAFRKHYPALNVDYQLIDSDDLLKSITDFVEENKVDVVALNTKRRNIFSRMFASPSMSRRILFTAKTALLVLRG